MLSAASSAAARAASSAAAAAAKSAASAAANAAKTAAKLVSKNTISNISKGTSKLGKAMVANPKLTAGVSLVVAGGAPNNYISCNTWKL